MSWANAASCNGPPSCWCSAGFASLTASDCDPDVYRTCLFCLGALGTNDVVEALPVGRTLAFDPGRGRLWVVCPSCRRWNLAPLEERWEAVETAERLFQDCGRRVVSENIGLCVFPGGTRLIRVGEVVPAEYASWRYGTQLRGHARPSRHRRLLWWLNSLVTGTLLSPGIYDRLSVIHRTGAGTDGVALRRMDLDGAVFRTDPESGLVQLQVTRSVAGPGRAVLDLEGNAARTLLDRMLLSVNRESAPERLLAPAVRFLGRHASLPAAFDAIGTEGDARGPGHLRLRYEGEGHWRGEWAPLGVQGYQPVPRYRTLALEMALHEDAERRALEGELRELLSRWKDAETIASITDSL